MTKLIVKQAPVILDYLRRGWSLIPMELEKKKPPVRWRRYQTRHACMNTIRRWFRERNYGVAVIFGDISGGLVSRDFDTMECYEQWATQFPELAESLPTVATRRGRHVYATATAENVQALRTLIGKPDRNGAIKVQDGELRLGVGCYCVLPPSVHPSGHIYSWLAPLPDGPLPEVDLFTCGFISEEELECYREHGVSGRARKVTEAMNVVENCSMSGVVAAAEGGGEPETASTTSEPPPELEEQIEQAIESSLPTKIGTRNKQVFQLARALRGISWLRDADPKGLIHVAREWHRRALPHISTQPFEETLIDFLRGWPNVRFPLGKEPMALALHRAATTPLPKVAEQFEQDKLKKLVALCRELQRDAGEQAFFLACRTAGRMLDVSHTQANRWLFLLGEREVLIEIRKGDAQTGLASRYRYKGDW